MAKKRNGNNHNGGPVVLLVLDGWGLGSQKVGNAIRDAKPKNFNRLWRSCPHAKLKADGKYVGLPEERVGNSEAGHITIGAGRIVDQDAVSISKDINTGRFFKNAALEATADHVKKYKSNLHIMGLLSNGQSGHSDPDHLLALLSWSRQKGFKNVYLHMFTDGRDAPPRSSLKMVEAFMRGLRNSENGKQLRGEWIATIMGRFYAMDRKKQWDRTAAAYHAMVAAEGRKAKSPQAAITQSYNRDQTDEFIEPHVIHRHGKPIATIKSGDGVIFYNLRSDRARQLTKVFVQKDFNSLNQGAFKRKKVLRNLAYVAMTDFGPDLQGILTAYPSADLADTLPMVFRKKRQLYIAEQEKYAHITFFFNGGYADPVAGEDRIVVASPDVPSYDAQPAMATNVMTANILEAIGTHDFVAANFAAVDMVAHTGNLEATVKAVESVDEALGKIAKAVLARKGILVITADHGNAEQMINPETEEIDTEHNPSPVPLILVGAPPSKRLRNGSLADVAPTILKLMKMKKPKVMSGRSLL